MEAKVKFISLFNSVVWTCDLAHAA